MVLNANQLGIVYGGVIVTPLLPTPYQLPADFQGANIGFDRHSCEPLVQNQVGNTWLYMLPQPHDYGLTTFNGGPVTYHGGNTYTMNDNTGYGVPAATFSWLTGNLFDSGGVKGQNYVRDPASTSTTYVNGQTSDVTYPAGQQWPSNPSDPQMKPGYLSPEIWRAGGLMPRYLDIQTTGPFPSALNFLDTEQDDGSILPGGRYNITVRGRKPTLGAFITDYGVSDGFMVSEWGGMFDSRFVLPDSSNPFYCYAGDYGNPFSYWQQGASLLLNTRGMMVDAVPGRGPAFQAYEASPECLNGMLFINSLGQRMAMGRGLNTYVAPSPSSPPDPHPWEMIAQGAPPALAAAFANAEIDNGYRHTSVLHFSMFPGQAFTPVVIDAAAGVFYTVQFQPQTPECVSAIADGGSLGNWSFKYSSRGYFMLINNKAGIQGQLFHTLGRIDLYKPTIIKPTMVDLPCFNPCVPNIIL